MADKVNTTDIEESIVGTESISEEVFVKDGGGVAPTKKRSMNALVCLKCTKEFDSSAFNASTSLCLCSTCNVTVEIEEPKEPDVVVDNKQERNDDVDNNDDDNRMHNDSLEVSAITGSDEKPDDGIKDNSNEVDNRMHNDSLEGSQINIEDSEEEDGVEIVDDPRLYGTEEDALETNDPILPSRPDPCNPFELFDRNVEDYKGFDTGSDVSDHIKAAMLGQQPFTVKIGKFGFLEFNQARDPMDFAIEGRNGYFKLVIDPYKRVVKLVFYGYDLFDAYQWDIYGLICLCMIILEDGFPSGFILFKIGKTRCVDPRVDGFLYHIGENK